LLEDGFRPIANTKSDKLINLFQLALQISHSRPGSIRTDLLQAVEMTIISDCGSHFNEGTSIMSSVMIKGSGYSSKAWKFSPKLAKTEKASNTFCRGPGKTL
jgi:hypothetical protein